MESDDSRGLKMNLGQYRDTKDMESVMLKKMHLYSEVRYACVDETAIEERIKNIRRIRKLIAKRRSNAFLGFYKKVKDLFYFN